VLFNLVEVCRILAVLLWPFLPGTAVKIYAQLGLTDSPARFTETRWGVLAPGHKISDPVPLFPIKEKPKAPGKPV
jgi:methionyl-tRNA synthetase